MPSVHGACKAPIQAEVQIGVPYRGNEFIFLSMRGLWRDGQHMAGRSGVEGAVPEAL